MSKSKVLILVTFVIIFVIISFWWLMSNKKNSSSYTIDDVNSIELINIKDIKIIDSNNSGFSKIYETNNQISDIMSIIKSGQYIEEKKTGSESGGWSLSVIIHLKDERTMTIYYSRSTVEFQEKIYSISNSEVVDNIYDHIYKDAQ